MTISTEQLMPIGSIVAYAGAISEKSEQLLKEGWLICDGRAVVQENYKGLFEQIRFNFGAPAEGNLFNLPDFRGLFLRGASNDTDNDPDKNTRTNLLPGGNTANKVGSYQEYATGKPQKPFKAKIKNNHIVNRSQDAGACVADSGRYGTGNTGGYSDGSGGDLETRPKNKYVYYLIKHSLYDSNNEPVTPPIGSVIPFTGEPNQGLNQNWIICDGNEYSNVGEFKELFDAIGTANGSSGDNLFNLPDYRGYFMRGVSMDAENRDPDIEGRTAAKPGGNEKNNVGSEQNDATAYPVSASFFTSIPGLPDQSGNSIITGSVKRAFTWNKGSVNQGLIENDSEGGGDDESRPINMSVDWFIRFR